MQSRGAGAGMSSIVQIGIELGYLVIQDKCSCLGYM